MTDTVALPDGQLRLIANASEPEIAPSGRLPARGEIGFIGLGHMGTSMAANLAAAGYRVIAYVRRSDQVDKLAALGLDPTTQVADLFDCEIVVSMVPSDSAVRDVVLGGEDAGVKGLVSGLKRDAIHLSMSTISTSTASRLSAERAVTGKATSRRRWESECRQGAPALHSRRRRSSRRRALSAVVRQSRTKDVRCRR